MRYKIRVIDKHKVQPDQIVAGYLGNALKSGTVETYKDINEARRKAKMFGGEVFVSDRPFEAVKQDDGNYAVKIKSEGRWFTVADTFMFKFPDGKYRDSKTSAEVIADCLNSLYAIQREPDQPASNNVANRYLYTFRFKNQVLIGWISASGASAINKEIELGDFPGLSMVNGSAGFPDSGEIIGAGDVQRWFEALGGDYGKAKMQNM